MEKIKKCSQNLSGKCQFYRKALGQLYKRPESMVAMRHILLAISFGY
jgi:hypothetical protein